MKKSKVLTMTAILISGSMMIGSKVFAANSSIKIKENPEWTINFLKRQADQNLDDVEAEINKVNKDTSITKFNMASVKGIFEDVVFLGDSITEYLKQGNILDASSVLAMKGEHINQASKHLEEIKNLKPKQIVILYGANDINAYSPEKYKEEYIKLVKSIQKVDPGVKIYLQAPLPVNESVASKKDMRINNDNIKMFSDKVKEVAGETGAQFLSSDGLITSNDLYEPDGIHLKYDFYKNWLFFLSENM
ncbi:MAG: GDSL-type esterase/lipase family protein [Peptostreptococcus sp.]|uniref:GDSL-type esterase/lipase family protein n=1 Tax=Peptostreptococcus sp. TaxID=1262 RepID=UPI002FCA32BE